MLIFCYCFFCHLIVSDRGPRNSSRQWARCTPVVNRSIEHHTGDSTIYLGSNPILRDPGGVSGASHLSSPSINLTRGLATRWLFRVLPCRKGTLHLRTSLPSPGFEHRPYGTAVSVTNHYTGWATPIR
ncbi:hypothetical protein TNCV_686791 [Trichonephila clavipes]|nr:hypothetical protein TNCV_686791 [Trichonephila clavipes]